ncbi:MAG: 4Fe-4S dicluster domain-containing protein [Humidesulfovibrio sp.]|uniref:4Fe-4S dicluster domain-containing protein n=1 Tax=Humidesulfovibrio sp. TaxID=2910988 RepID=UPI0027326E54|nr:4Fe-4S dicluster domain-containing protein [Humidesulfovibrio sp.]MDP2847112.1 4Fe-4S dicluster domain-containing protein [Humidesulfovibrio sp.]
MVARFLATEALADIAAAWARDHRLLAPVREGAAVLYRPWAKDMHPFLGRPPTSSAKEALLPQTENLLTYTYRKDRDDLTRTEVFLAEPLPQEPTLVLGSRPCDARGRKLLDRVFLERGVKDPLYEARRKATLFVTVACERLENTCFCHWTGGGPMSEEGSDVLLFAVSGGFAAKAITEAGEQLLAPLPEVGPQVQEELAAKLASPVEPGPAPDLSKAPERFLKLFGDMDFWMDQSARCLSCGVCTYLCPTCSCFNITDENSGMKGKRLRTWDTCMSALYTLEGSGHNPRVSRAHRLRNRVGHKFCYHPQEFPAATAQPEFSCTGCGRCIKSCPVSVDIRSIVLDILEKGDKS